MPVFKHIFVALILIALCVTPAFSVETTLAWDASPSSDVAGYKVYYKKNSMVLPFDGVDAIEGPSPIDVGPQLTAKLSGLDPSAIYYITLTAYDSTGLESSYSNIVSFDATNLTSRWIPELLRPENRAINVPIPVTFQWSSPPGGLTVNYTLYYGTDPNLVASVGSPIQNNPPWRPTATGLLSLLLLVMGLPLVALKRTLPRHKPALLATLFVLAILVNACGGGGGGDSNTTETSSSQQPSGPAPTDTTEPSLPVVTTPPTGEPTQPPPTSPDTGTGGEVPGDTAQPPGGSTPGQLLSVYAVEKGSSDYHQEYNLAPSTTYFWKVVAINLDDPSLTYTSPINQFTTEQY